MTEQQIREFGTHARAQVVAADWDELERRAGRRTLRRRVLASAAAACILGLAGYLAVPGRAPTFDLPAIHPDATPSQDGSGGAQTYPVPDSVGEPGPLPAGTYDLLFSYEPLAPVVRFSVPAGWRDGSTPYRVSGSAMAFFTVFTLEAAVEIPCRVLDTGMRRVGAEPASVASALADLPGQRTVLGPEPDRRFGMSVTHLRIQETSGGQCPQGRLPLFRTAASGYFLPSGKPGATTDFWVGTSGGYPFVVATFVEPGTPAAVRDQLLGIVDSVEFDAG